MAATNQHKTYPNSGHVRGYERVQPVIEYASVDSRRFNELLSRFQAWRQRKDAVRVDDIEKLLDELNDLNYKKKFGISDQDLSGLVKFCCERIPTENSGVVEKLCRFICSIYRGQELLVSNCREDIVSFLLSSLRVTDLTERSTTTLLQALSVVLYKNGIFLERFYSSLTGGQGAQQQHEVGVLMKYLEHSDLEILSSAVECLRSLTTELNDESVKVIRHEHLENFCQCLVKVLRLLRLSGGSAEALTCRMVLTALHGLNNILVALRSAPSVMLLESLLSALHVYMMYGLPNAPTIVSSSLRSLPVSLINLSLGAGASETESSRGGQTRDGGGSASKGGQGGSQRGSASRRPGRGGRVPGCREVNEGGGDGEEDMEESLMAFCGVSSESESSDCEIPGEADGWMNREVRYRAQVCKRIRIMALHNLKLLTKIVEKRVMFGYWSLFIPDKAEGGGAVSNQHTLFMLIASDPSNKTRYAALTLLHSLLEGSKQFLHAAEDVDQYRNLTFIPHSITLGHMIKELHARLFLVLSSEVDTTPYTIIALKSLAMLISSVPYHRLRPGLLKRAVNTVTAYLRNRDSNIRVAALTCLGRVVGVHAPLMEVSQIIQSHRYVGRQSERLSLRQQQQLAATTSDSLTERLGVQTDGNAICEAYAGTNMSAGAQVDVDIAHAGASAAEESHGGGNAAMGARAGVNGATLTPNVTPMMSGSMSPSCYWSIDTDTGGGVLSMSWLVKHCVDNVAPHLVNDQQDEDFLSSSDNSGSSSPRKRYRVPTSSESHNWRDIPTSPRPAPSSSQNWRERGSEPPSPPSPRSNWREPPSVSNALPSRRPASTLPLPVQLESLQILQQLAKGYFIIIIRPHLQLMRRVIEICLSHPKEKDIRLHGAKLLHMISSMLLHHTNQEPVDSKTYNDYIQLAVDLWRPLLLWMGGLISTTRQSDDRVTEVLCDCMANVGPIQVFQQLSQEMEKYVEELEGLTRANNPKIKAAAVTALGNYVTYSRRSGDLAFLVKIANVLLKAEEKEKNSTVRCKIASSLSNLSDSIVYYRLEGNEEFVSSFSMELFTGVLEVCTRMCGDVEKVRCNAVRAVGNLLRFFPQQYCGKSRYDETVNYAVRVVIDNISFKTVKVSRNACFAVGNIFKNEELLNSISTFLVDILQSLMQALRSSDNYKVRISSVAAIREPQQRQWYGSEAEFSRLWQTLLEVLSNPLPSTDPAEQQYRTSLPVEICQTISHLTSLVSVTDLETLNPVLVAYTDCLSEQLSRFQLDLPDAPLHHSGAVCKVLERAMIQISMLRTHSDLSPIQLSTIDRLHSVYIIRPLVDDTEDISTQHNVLPSGFIQSYD